MFVQFRLKHVVDNKMILKTNDKHQFFLFLLSRPFPFISFREAGFIRCANATMTQPERTLRFEKEAFFSLRYLLELVDNEIRNRTSHLFRLVKAQAYNNEPITKILKLKNVRFDCQIQSPRSHACVRPGGPT